MAKANNSVTLAGKICKRTNGKGGLKLLRKRGEERAFGAMFTLAVYHYKSKDGNTVYDFINCRMNTGPQGDLSRLFKDESDWEGKNVVCYGAIHSQVYEKDGQKKNFTYFEVEDIRYQFGNDGAAGSFHSVDRQESESESSFEDIDDLELPY